MFVFMLIVVAAVLLSGRGNDATDDGTPDSAIGGPTSTSSGLIAAEPTIETSATRTTSLVATATQASQPTATTPADEPTPTTAEDPAATEESEPEATPTDEPTVEPVIGEFGELPPAEIPSGGLGRDLSLNYELAVAPEDMPTEGVVYSLLWTDRSAEDVAALASAVGIDGEVVDQGDGRFDVVGPGGSLTVTPGSVQYEREGGGPSGALEVDDAALLEAARTWLLDNGLVQDDVDAGVILSRDDDAGRASAYFTTTEPAPLLAAYPSARITLGTNGSVMEAYVRWPNGYDTANYGLRGIEELWADVSSGRGYVEADLSSVPGEGAITGTLTVTEATLAWSTAGNAVDGEYLVPVVVFRGDAQLDESGQTVPISVYIQAVYGEGSPRG